MNIAIVGAGLIGRILAWQLLEKGCAVTLFDKDAGAGEFSAGLIAAAMLAPYSEVLDADEQVYHYGVKGLDVWTLWAGQLLQSTQIDIGLQLQGSVVVAHRQDRGDFQRFYQRIRGVDAVDQSKVYLLDEKQLLQCEPELAARFDTACLLSQEGCLDNVMLFKALATRIKALGGEWRYRENIDGEDKWRELTEQFDQVIDCRGFGAKSALTGLRGVRGEVMRVYAPDVNLSRPVRLMHPRYKLYIAPKHGSEFVIGATQIESESEQAITVRSSMELLSALYSVHTGFSEATLISQSARCRPAFLDNLPRIVVRDRFMAINGLYRHGYLLAPMVIKQVLACILQENSAWPEIVIQNEKKVIGL